MTTLATRPEAASPAEPGVPVEPDHNPRWVLPALLALLAGTAGLYLWDLSASGWGNSFYAAAAQAGGDSWKAWFFGSFDASNLITVDKPPASLWVMGLSVRVFGLSSWSVLVPQALMGVATVGVLYATVRRWAGPAAGLVAGTVLALTPVAALMFRFDNPDALLVLLLTTAAYALVRATEKASTRWLLLVGAIIGFAFLTKMLQAFLVLPAFALVYLLVADTSVRRRLLQLLGAGLAMVAGAGWWIAIVELWPASSRPYIGGSQTNSVLELAFGYNGLGRLTGDETGSVTAGGTGGGGTSMWGSTGITRLFDGSYGGQASWLIPAALLMSVALLWFTIRAPRTDRTRAAVILWAGWLLVTGLTFSFMAGIIHQYYTVALAPPIAALVGIGSVELWRRRGDLVARILLAATIAVTAWWSWVLLGRSSDFVPWLRPVVLGVGVVIAVVVLSWHRLPRALALTVAGAALAVGLAGPAAYTIQTVTTAHSGSIVTAGPAVADSMGGPGGFGGGPGGGMGGPPTQGAGGTTGTTQGGTPPQGAPTGGFGGGPGGQGAAAGGVGGLLGSTSPSVAMVSLLQTDASSYRWVAAAIGSNTAAGYQLATEDPVMAIGGFNGSDPAPTLAEFQQYVADGDVHYFISGGVSGQSNGGSDSAQAIASWVEDNFTATTVGGVTVYDLTASTASTSTS